MARLGRPFSWRPWLLAGFAALAPSCDDGIDTTRQAPPKATLGDDIYQLLCDRLGASVFTEDLTGASYHAICHFDAQGSYGFAVDQGVLPPVSGEAAVRARALSVAKLERMARLRDELVKALNAALPDVDIDDPTTPAPGDTIRLHDALLAFSQDVTALYEDNPLEPGQAPIVPMTTDAFGRVFGDVEHADDARAALARIGGREGYRPTEVALGAIAELLGYPELRALVAAAMEVLGPDGSGAAELQQLLAVVQGELATAPANVAALPPLTIDEASGEPSRPRSALELAGRLLLAEDAGYATGATQRYLPRRDARGFAMPAASGSPPPPFVDGDGDGLADVDGLGRFVGADGTPLEIDPFFAPGSGEPPPLDPFGRPVGSPFAYVDASQTLLGALLANLAPLVDATVYAPEAPQPWQEENETLMYALAGLRVLAGPRMAAQLDHESETILGDGATCPGAVCTRYQRFAGELSPLPDLVHALGQVLAHPDSDVILLGLRELLEHHRPVVARLVGAALRAREIGKAHDALAEQGAEPRAELAYEVPVWDEMAQILSDMAQHPGLVAKLLRALADPALVTPHAQDPRITGAPAQHMGETVAAFMRYRDRYGYDHADINGPAVNLTDGGGFANPHNEVDRGAPLRGDNRSMFERSAQLIFDGARVKACNKSGAKIYTGVGDIYVPPFGGYPQCGLFVFDNVAAYYLTANLPDAHPKRAELRIEDAGLQDLVVFLGSLTNLGPFLENASGILGFTLKPTPRALNRLLFYGAESEEWGLLPDYDTDNAGGKTDKFVANAVEPVCGAVSPPNALGVATCQSVDEVLRVRDGGAIFGWERLGFYEYLAPQLEVWAEVGCNADVTQCDRSNFTGENFFLDHMSTLWRHWPGEDHGDNCSSTVAKSDPRYCSGAGIDRYEPILSEVLAGDMIPALHELAKTAAEVDIVYRRGPKAGQSINGTEIVELLVKILFDQSHAASAGMRDRAGNASSTWVDGTPQAQVTPYAMFADALHRMDLAFDESSDDTAHERRSKWKRARSQLTDRFLAVTGEGAASDFDNPMTAPALSAVLAVVGEQLNAHCPSRESGGGCAWASHELGAKLADLLSRPVFAAVADLTDKIAANEPARRALERFFMHVLSDERVFGLLASLADAIQLVAADGDFAPIFRALAGAASPRAAAEGPGAGDRLLHVLEALSGDRYDRYHVLDHVLPALVTPLASGRAPLEVIVSAIADVHRVDATAGSPLDAGDHQVVMKTLREFFTDDERGLHQLYHIVQNRPRP